MKIQIDVAMEYDLSGDMRACLAVEAAKTPVQTVLSEELSLPGATLTRTAGEAGLGQRIWVAMSAPRMSLRYSATAEITRDNSPLENFALTPRHELPGEVMTFLRPSRYCQSDMFPAFVARRFGEIEGGAKVAAMRDWVREEMTYVPGTSNATTTVIDTFAAREGVCRDYAHMVCALARAADIPARYCSVYGIGVEPPDFHAVAQVYLGGAWHVVDATGMCEPDQVAVISVGRDACDVAFMETSDPAGLIEQSVSVRPA
ncbi:Transglutaminase-like enzyme, putative cysteine protease [Poseidonocella pacifica]|uniref:Transglutaminase-like enzyme, putative cysteine protease n=1 Tax=Poseidonocella pacifica TaxID=871651 RepID=A0A1I0VU00_9RHOB|nr:transglutaminase family protein [Poseidonocella pacifica]SFA79433.1 Transglutaminase-like enzyme, putative cysteine protease [Poseidonocella pacifica]